MKENDSFLEIHKGKMDVLGFWDETYKSTILRQIENAYKTEIIAEWCITDVVMNGEKILLKWNKRHHSLSKEELKKLYDR